MANLLKVADLTPEQIAKFSWWRCDEMYEKHESYGNWEDSLGYCDFVEIEGKSVLLPRYPDDLTDLHVDECIISKDDRVLTIFLKDLSMAQDRQNPTRREIFAECGYFAICYRVEGEEFYVAVVCHARYITQGPIAGSEGGPMPGQPYL